MSVIRTHLTKLKLSYIYVEFHKLKFIQAKEYRLFCFSNFNISAVIFGQHFAISAVMLIPVI